LIADEVNQLEVELKFIVPQVSRAGIRAELARGSATRSLSLMAMYLDTEDRRLAREGLSWRLRREGWRWVQTLKVGSPNALERFEHEVDRADATPDASEHAGTPPGDRLIALLRRARAQGVEPEVRFRTAARRTVRRIRTRGAVVEVAFDEGRLISGGSEQRIREIEFELISGSPAAMLGLAQRWRKRFALIYDPHSKSERGDCLAEGAPFPPVRKALPMSYRADATAAEVFGVVLDECLAQVTRNAVGLIAGDAAQRVEHVHQLRVGIRRLRSALRSFKGWVPEPPADLVAALRALFATLGRARDVDVFAVGLMTELARAGAPPLALPRGGPAPDLAKALGAGEAQQALVAWIAWRAALMPEPAPDATRAQHAAAASGRADDGGPQRVAAPTTEQGNDARRFQRAVARRLRRWHARIVADWQRFDVLDDAGLHALRKRIKRQRYAVEFFAPMLRRRQVGPYLDALAALQDRMGALNDHFVARGRCQSCATADPAIWFALGWLSARIAELRAQVRPELARVARAEPPRP
jgi:inorganic triphosphatase YgiF